METIQVVTAQNVRIDYPMAGLGDRMLAWLLDFIIIIAYLVTAYYLFFEMADSPDWVQYVLFIPTLLYHPVCEILMEGQSPGKKFLRIKVIKLDGSRPSISAYVIRGLLRLIDIPLNGSVAIISIVFTRNNQRLGDIAAGTTVIKLTRSSSLSNNPLRETFEEDYDPVYTQAYKLSDEDIDLIGRVLDHNRRQADRRPAELLAEKIRAKLEIETEEPTLKFLYTIRKDYHHLTS